MFGFFCYETVLYNTSGTPCISPPPPVKPCWVS